ncbi:DUF4352 domain-containing protein [Bacillus alkalicellulosilyticus]|uniref:DUF4352 domain-containing protein n=1 Tax=Alkalihalobacterium alkalicellulosilyticum TaxID=1912214 RepID=UPI000998C6E7
MTLGETGLYDTPVGKFDITVHSVKISESEGEHFPISDVFLIFDISLKNNHNEEVNSIDILRSVLFNENETSSGNQFHLDFIEEFPITVSPGETVTGQLIFDHFESSYYELVFGHALPAEDIIWRFNIDEAE